jgi:hypothetical protein
VPIVQSPLRLSACAHAHMHTRIGMRASSDARLATTRGAGRCSRWTRDQHGCGSYCRTSATREFGSDSDFQVWGSSDDILLTSPTRGWLSDGACVHFFCAVSRVTAPAVFSSLNAKGRDSLHKVDVPDRVLVCTACGTCSTFTGKPPKLSMETVLRRIPDCLRRH